MSACRSLPLIGGALTVFKAFVTHPRDRRVLLPIPAADWRDMRDTATADARAYALLTWPNDTTAREAFMARVRITETRV